MKPLGEIWVKTKKNWSLSSGRREVLGLCWGKRGGKLGPIRAKQRQRKKTPGVSKGEGRINHRRWA